MMTATYDRAARVTRHNDDTDINDSLYNVYFTRLCLARTSFWPRFTAMIAIRDLHYRLKDPTVSSALSRTTCNAEAQVRSINTDTS